MEESIKPDKDQVQNNEPASSAEALTAEPGSSAYRIVRKGPPITSAEANAKLLMGYEKIFGKSAILPGESPKLFMDLFQGFSQHPQLPFEPYLGKEITDSILRARRWRSASTAYIDTTARKIAETDLSKRLHELGNGSARVPVIPPLGPRETTAILAHYGMGQPILNALSIVETRGVRAEFTRRAEAAERSFHAGLDTFQYLRFATTQIGTARNQVEFLEKRFELVTGPRRFESVQAWTEHCLQGDDQSERFVAWEEGLEWDDLRFTPYARSLLGDPPLITGESEQYYAGMFAAVMGCFGKLQLWDPHLINDAAAATWEIRRLREAEEVLTTFLFRRRIQYLLGQGDSVILRDFEVAQALEKAGIKVGAVTAVTLQELAEVLDSLDQEIERLAERRMRSLRHLIMLRARGVRSDYLNTMDRALSRKAPRGKQ